MSEYVYKNLYQKLTEWMPEERVKKEEPMRLHTTFRVGGPADLFVSPNSVEEVCKVTALCREEGVPYYIMGNGSNLLVSDQGYRGVIIQFYKEMNDISVEGTLLRAQAGALCQRLLIGHFRNHLPDLNLQRVFRERLEALA